MSGFTNLSGEEGGSPQHMNFQVGDAVAGLFAAFSTDAIFARLAAAVDRPEWASDERFATNIQRVVHLRELDRMLSEWFAARPYEAIERTLEAAGIPFSKVYSIEDIERDPQFVARQAIVRLPDPQYGSVPAPCIVPRITGREMPIPRTGPDVGEHNAEVYSQFGVPRASSAPSRRRA